jgi:hypothetical protein
VRYPHRPMSVPGCARSFDALHRQMSAYVGHGIATDDVIRADNAQRARDCNAVGKS